MGHGGHHGGHGGHHHGGRGWGGGWGYYDPYDGIELDDFEVVQPIVVPVVLKQGETSPEEVTMFGAIDVAAYERQMNTLKQVPVSIARILVKGGTAAINNAILTAKQPWYKPDLPGDTERNNVLWKLKWHEAELAKVTDGNAIYGAADDLKKWVLTAYLDANATEEGAAWVAPMWSQMWSEIGAAIAALPKALAQKINETAGSLLGMPLWIVVLGGLGIVGTAGYAFSKAYGSAKGSR